MEAQTPPGRRLLVVSTGQRLVRSSVQKWEFSRMPPNLLCFPALCISEATIWVTVIREQRQRRSVHGNSSVVSEQIAGPHFRPKWTKPVLGLGSSKARRAQASHVYKSAGDRSAVEWHRRRRLELLVMLSSVYTGMFSSRRVPGQDQHPEPPGARCSPAGGRWGGGGGALRRAALRVGSPYPGDRLMVESYMHCV